MSEDPPFGDVYTLCKNTATYAYKGKYRRNGRLAISHMQGVVDALASNNDLMSVAYLHDIVEDGHFTIIGLLALGIPNSIVSQVEILTHTTLETYEDYILRVCQHKDLCRVKLADMLDNLTDRPTMKQREKYKKAYPILLSNLTEEADERITSTE